MQLKIKDEVVVLKDELTWGDAQKIQGALTSGAKIKGAGSEMGFDFDSSALLESKYVALECAIIGIEKKGETKSFTREWMDGLSIDDGNKIVKAVDALSKKK